MKISVCIVSQNDKPFLEQAIAAANEYADEIVIVNNDSIDGTAEYLSRMREVPGLGPKLNTIWAPRHLVLDNGFSILKNLAADCATGDWIHSLDADECLAKDQRPLLRPFLEQCKKPVVSIWTHTFRREGKVTTIEFDELSKETFEESTHRRIYRRDAGISWRGYIHEELYQGETNCESLAERSHFKHWHFTNFRTWSDPSLKNRRYAWMLLRAYDHPELQQWTNRWWYTSYVPNNLKMLNEASDRFQEIFDRGEY